jgi:hypothetical protein
MSEQPNTEDNVTRLLKHLKDDSLAARLVLVHRALGARGLPDAIKAILKERLRRIRGELEDNKN